jgi:hypothetical protein
MLHISAPAALSDNARTIGTLDGDAPSSTQVVMNIHVAIGDVYIADTTVRAPLNCAAIRGV